MNSKGWEWEKAKQEPWLKPSEDSYFLANKWSESGYERILDLGAGLGRHSIYFASQGFSVSAIDISNYAVEYLKQWALREKLDIDIRTCDMLSLPYEDGYFDCVFANHVISHTDTKGAVRVIAEIERILKPGGELYTSMCSKSSCEFLKEGSLRVDENTIIRNEEGPEKDVPHFYVDCDDILDLMNNFDIEKIRHIDYCYHNSQKQDSKYFYINARKK